MADDIVYISNIQRYSVHDGPGIRTIVFFLGCPLRCKWCQNPETFSNRPVLMFNDELCSRCGACIDTCPQKAIFFDESGKVNTDREKCTNCGRCIDSCFYLARQMTGSPYTVNELYHEIKKDLIFYKNTGGGITLSGGEPTLHLNYCYELLNKCHLDKINTAIETCGLTEWDNLAKIMTVTDLFLYDFKLLDSKKHQKWTGVDNKLIINNLKKLVEADQNVIVRIPLIPGVNDDDEEFSQMVFFIKELKKINTIHIMPFHQIGSSKYNMIQVDYSLADLAEITDENVARCSQIAQKMGFKISIGGAGFKEDSAKMKISTPNNSSFLYPIK